MDTNKDLLQWLHTDIGIDILKCLDNPADLVRASTVSRFWHNLVITNGLSKQLSLKRFPQLWDIEYISAKSNDDDDEANHNIYASLLHHINLSILSPIECIAKAISASSTDNYPDESIMNTLNPRDRDRDIYRASYWSSTGQEDPTVSETLIYRLRANFCVITAIKIQPFQAFFQRRSPIYSAKYMRFRMGHPKSVNEIEKILYNSPIRQPVDDKFIWTYTSQDFPMAQENCLQEFKLAEPVLCIGGFMQIELFGRVEKQEMDGLYYICVAHVKVMGRPLSPAFDIQLVESSGNVLLRRRREGVELSDENLSNIQEISELIKPNGDLICQENTIIL